MEEIDEQRRISRRRMAIVSFSLIVMKGALVTLALLLHPDRQEIATALATASAATTGIFTALVSIIFLYLSASTAEKITKVIKDAE
jgi:hypothetical protein